MGASRGASRDHPGVHPWIILGASRDHPMVHPGVHIGVHPGVHPRFNFISRSSAEKTKNNSKMLLFFFSADIIIIYRNRYIHLYQRRYGLFVCLSVCPSLGIIKK